MSSQSDGVADTAHHEADFTLGLDHSYIIDDAVKVCFFETCLEVGNQLQLIFIGLALALALCVLDFVPTRRLGFRIQTRLLGVGQNTLVSQIQFNCLVLSTAQIGHVLINGNLRDGVDLAIHFNRHIGKPSFLIGTYRLYSHLARLSRGGWGNYSPSSVTKANFATFFSIERVTLPSFFNCVSRAEIF